MNSCCSPPSDQTGKYVVYSVIKYPHCGLAKTEQMPIDSRRIVYECIGCGATLRPVSGDCCVFCSYGSVPCPPVQATRTKPD